MKATEIEQGRFEPTVFGAVRRYRVMVLVITVLMAAGAVGYSLVQTEVFRATATITVPQTTLAQDESRNQYFDSQVLLMQSQEVADRAARIANAALNHNLLSRHDFAGEGRSLEITPPEQSTPGAFGSSIVTVSFTWPSSRVAQTGVNAALQAFDDARSAEIAAQGAAAVAAVERAIQDDRTQGQRADLLDQRTQTLVNLQLDLATHPTVAWASEPQVPINGNSKRAGAIGLMAGLVLGAGLAYARASRHRRLGDRLDPVAIYDAPLIADIPPAGASRILPGPPTATDPLPMAADPQSPSAEAFRFTAGSLERIRAVRDDRMAVVFVSADTGADRSAVVANVALAVAESGTPVLAVDADAAEGTLTELLLPGSPPVDGFEQVVAGSRPVSDCVETSPLNADVTVLPAGLVRLQRTTGTAYAQAVERLLTEAKTAFDIVLVDGPAVLRAANAVELVNDSDAAIVVLSSDESVHDHVTVVERLDQVDSNVAGYIYRRAGHAPKFLRRLREQTAARAAPRTRRSYVPSAPRFAFHPAKAPRPTARLPRG
ncbi:MULTISPECIES: Wzz/FepE/Etk N-terminal domain-containing protein [unclassified Kribbella]|uniref:Wzz/FepE/Etk N-terminal domain-containing protein n=1 Tax=unclassified Kribbella TaxID=2644121 RepID=UPI003015D8B4